MKTIKRIKTGDTVKIIAGSNKGTIGKVVKISPADNLAYVEGVGKRTRHMRPTQYQKAGKKEVQSGIHLSNLQLVIDAKTNATSRVGYAKNSDGKTVRIARQANNREIK